MSAVLNIAPKPKKERTVNVSTETYVSVDVDVPLEDIPTEDLVEELASRDGQTPTALSGIYEAMAAGKKDYALELMREYLMNVTGRVLP